MFLVVHVPKTAGTSFRNALEKSFGIKRVARDYGAKAKVTSSLVQQHVYNDSKIDCETLLGSLSDNGVKVLIGHFPAAKYAAFFEPKNIITFVRDPLLRTCSEYLHRVRLHQYEHSFDRFILRDNIINIQSRFLNQLPEDSFVGITERYSESLLYINSEMGLRLKQRKKNVGKAGGGSEFAKSLSSKQLERFFELNQQDVELYDRSLRRFESLDIPESKKLTITDFFKRR